jgi:hypothetical protein
VAEDWRRLHSEDLRNSYVSPNIIRAIKSLRVIWVRHGRNEKRIQSFGRKT